MAEHRNMATTTARPRAVTGQAIGAFALALAMTAGSGCAWFRGSKAESTDAVKPDRAQSEARTGDEIQQAIDGQPQSDPMADLDPTSGAVVETETPSRPTETAAAPSQPDLNRPMRPNERVAEAEKLRSEGRVEDAIKQLELAIRDNPKLTTAYISLAEIHRQQGNLAAAEKAAREAVALDSGSFEARYNYALTLQMMGRLTDSVREYLKALAIRPNDREANLNLATAYLQLNEPAQALPYAQKAVKLDADHGPSRVNLGAVLGAMDRHQEAVTEYEAAAELMELSPQLLLNWADSLSKIQRYQEAVNTLDRLLQIEPSGPNAVIAYERLGSSYFRLRQYEKALDSFRRSVELDPGHYPGLNGVGVCLLNRYLTTEPRDKVSLDEALRALRRSLQINERQPRIVELLSRYG